MSINNKNQIVCDVCNKVVNPKRKRHKIWGYIFPDVWTWEIHNDGWFEIWKGYPYEEGVGDKAEELMCSSACVLKFVKNHLPKMRYVP